METEPTLGDILKAVKANDTRIDEVLEAVNKGFSGVQVQIEDLKTRVTGVETGLTGVETRLTGVETRLTKVEATMVTKDYLDEKLAKTDGKINSLVGILERKSVIALDDKHAILA